MDFLCIIRTWILKLKVFFIILYSLSNRNLIENMFDMCVDHGQVLSLCFIIDSYFKKHKANLPQILQLIWYFQFQICVVRSPEQTTGQVLFLVPMYLNKQSPFLRKHSKEDIDTKEMFTCFTALVISNFGTKFFLSFFCSRVCRNILTRIRNRKNKIFLFN